MTEHKWQKTGEPGVICYGDTGFIIFYDKVKHRFVWKAPNGRTSWTMSLKTCKADAEHCFREFEEIGLTI